jgi:hypothetical protein
MQILTICHGPTGTVTQFNYKTREAAEKSQLAIWSGADEFSTINDDFNTHAQIKRSSIHSVCLEDADESMNVQIERQLSVARANIKLQNKAANDPSIKLANSGFALNHPGAPGRGLPRLG